MFYTGVGFIIIIYFSLSHFPPFPYQLLSNPFSTGEMLSYGTILYEILLKLDAFFLNVRTMLIDSIAGLET